MPPPLPELEANMLPEGQQQIYGSCTHCNWMQGLEGDIDTVHAAFLHCGADQAEDTASPAPSTTTRPSSAPRKFSVMDTDFGTSYGAYRPAEDDTYYWRIAHILFPFYTMIPTGTLGPDVRFGMPTCRWTTRTHALGDHVEPAATRASTALRATAAGQATAPGRDPTGCPTRTGLARPLPPRAERGATTT